MSEKNPLLFPADQLTILTCNAPDTDRNSDYNKPFTVVWNADAKKLSLFSTALYDAKNGSWVAGDQGRWKRDIKDSAIALAKERNTKVFWAVAENWSKADIYRTEQYDEFAAQAKPILAQRASDAKTARMSSVLARFGNPMIPQLTAEGEVPPGSYLHNRITMFDDNARFISSDQLQKNYFYSDWLFSYATGNSIDSVKDGSWQEPAADYQSGTDGTGMSVDDMINATLKRIHANQSESADSVPLEAFTSRTNVILPFAFFEASRQDALRQGVAILPGE